MNYSRKIMEMLGVNYGEWFKVKDWTFFSLTKGKILDYYYFFTQDLWLINVRTAKVEPMALMFILDGSFEIVKLPKKGGLK